MLNYSGMNTTFRAGVCSDGQGATTRKGMQETLQIDQDTARRCKDSYWSIP